jgi:hypothetical protein
MSHRVGALLLPAPPPAFGPRLPNEPDVAPIQDPALDVLGQFFRAILEFYCGEAWKSIAPSEPVVRVLSIGHDPEELDFSDNDVPLLALWREHDGVPTRLTDGNSQAASVVHVMWVAAPADEQKLAARSPFFNAFQKAMLLAYHQQRDPCWVRLGEEDNIVSRTYGSYVWGLAGLDGWTYNGSKRVPLVVPVGSGDPQIFPGYLAAWTILESTEADPAAYGSTINGVRVGTGVTSVDFNLTDRTPTEEDPDVFVRQHARVPKT